MAYPDDAKYPAEVVTTTWLDEKASGDVVEASHMNAVQAEILRVEETLGLGYGTLGTDTAILLGKNSSGTNTDYKLSGGLAERLSDVDLSLDDYRTHKATSTNVHGLSGGSAVVGTGAVQSLSNKTLVSAVLSGTTDNSGATISGGTVNATTLQQGGVQTILASGTQTIGNGLTLTTPIIASFYRSNGGNLISVPSPANADELVLKNQTQTLQGKTLTSATLSGTTTNTGATISGGTLSSATVDSSTISNSTVSSSTISSSTTISSNDSLPTVSVSKGGTNTTTSPSAGQILVASGSTAYTPRTIQGTSNQVSVSSGSTGAVTISLPNTVNVPTLLQQNGINVLTESGTQPVTNKTITGAILSGTTTNTGATISGGTLSSATVDFSTISNSTISSTTAISSSDSLPTVPVTKGGTNTTTAPTSAGQILVASGTSAYTPRTIQGTSNQISVSSGSTGAVTFSLPSTVNVPTLLQQNGVNVLTESGFQTVTNKTINSADNSITIAQSSVTGLGDSLGGKQPLNDNLTKISAFSGTNEGFLIRATNGDWALTTTTTASITSDSSATNNTLALRTGVGAVNATSFQATLGGSIFNETSGASAITIQRDTGPTGPTSGSLVFDQGGTAGKAKLIPTANMGGFTRTITLPNATTTLVGLDTQDTLTNKTISTSTISSSTTISSATSLPTVTVEKGGTGNTSFTANRVVLSGSTSAGNLRSLTSGNSGQLLSSNGSGNDPSWVSSSSSNTANAVVQRDSSGVTSLGGLNLNSSGNVISSFSNIYSSSSTKSTTWGLQGYSSGVDLIVQGGASTTSLYGGSIDILSSSASGSLSISASNYMTLTASAISLISNQVYIDEPSFSKDWTALSPLLGSAYAASTAKYRTLGYSTYARIELSGYLDRTSNIATGTVTSIMTNTSTFLPTAAQPDVGTRFVVATNDNSNPTAILLITSTGIIQVLVPTGAAVTRLFLDGISYYQNNN